MGLSKTVVSNILFVSPLVCFSKACRSPVVYTLDINAVTRGDSHMISQIVISQRSKSVQQECFCIDTSSFELVF